VSKTLRIRMLTSMQGEGVSLDHGCEYDVDETFARALVAQHEGEYPRAEPVGWTVGAAAPRRATSKSAATREKRG
jgi:hypothetical protein